MGSWLKQQHNTDIKTEKDGVGHNLVEVQLYSLVLLLCLLVVARCTGFQWQQIVGGLLAHIDGQIVYFPPLMTKTNYCHLLVWRHRMQVLLGHWLKLHLTSV